jgi:UDP-glucuronate 4-epimerase
MTVLVTGAAGFIGFHVAKALLAQGRHVVGIDNLNDYYDVSLKQARLEQLQNFADFTFLEENIADQAAMLSLAKPFAQIDVIIHLAAQAGVRYSLENPYAYVDSNLMGQVVMLELARRLPKLRHFVYASSSSVYGANTKLPFAVEDRVDDPVSLYAATKRSGELITETYSRLYALPVTGLRFFTVYGPWGRPDMAYFSFVKAAFDGTPIKVFNHGQLRRDFTYISDIVAGVLAVADKPPVESRSPRAKLYNLGNNRSEALRDFIQIIEKATGKRLDQQFTEMQKGDVTSTFADITASGTDFGYRPTISIEEGIPQFVEWYRGYYGV